MLFDKMSSKTRYMTIAGLAVVVPAGVAFGLFQLLDATQAGGPSSLKVAVVNADQPVKHNGAKLAVGKKLLISYVIMIVLLGNLCLAHKLNVH